MSKQTPLERVSAWLHWKKLELKRQYKEHPLRKEILDNELDFANDVEALIAEVRSLQNEVHRLNKQLADAPIVYGCNIVITDPSSPLEFMGPNARVVSATHSAKLVDIRLITNEIEEE